MSSLGILSCTSRVRGLQSNDQKLQFAPMQRARVAGSSPASEKLKTRRISGGSCLKRLFPLKESNTIVETVGSGYPIQGDRYLYPIIAPALIIVGSMMLSGTARIRWDDPTEAIPAFLTISIIPFSVSITEGLAFGFISYSILKAVSGQGLKVHWLFHLVSAAFVARYVLLRG